MKVTTFKMPFATTHFNANQRVWVVQLTGAQAALCVGKFRGRGRYVEAWVRWDGSEQPEPKLETFEVDAEFARRHRLEGAAEP